MVRTSRLVLIGFFLLASAEASAASAEAGAARSIGEASKRVERARADLATAVQRIEVEPPRNADLDTALAAADHGDRKSALRAARAEWDRRQTVHTADALAWALHVNGKDEEALPYARKATATGYRNAAFLYHRGVIEHATGDAEDARKHLAAALKLNPGFSPLGARQARTALKDLEANRRRGVTWPPPGP